MYFPDMFAYACLLLSAQIHKTINSGSVWNWDGVGREKHYLWRRDLCHSEVLEFFT